MSVCEKCGTDVEGFESCPQCSVEIETKVSHGAYGLTPSGTDSREDGTIRPLPIRLGGGLLRFLGMGLIVMGGLSLLIDASVGYSSSIKSLVIVLGGVGMHLLGRKITPGAVGVGASVGGAAVGLSAIVGFILFILWMLYMFITGITG